MTETMRERVGHKTSGLKKSVKRQRKRLRDMRDAGQQIARLRKRLTDLENEVQENRRLNRRIAELTDVVQELLLPPEARDEAKIRERLNHYDPGH